MTPQGKPIRVEVPGLGIVEFPEGTSEDTMRSAITKQLGAPKPSAEPPPRAPIAGRGTGYDPRGSADTGRMLVDNLPTIASIAAMPFTGGMSALGALGTAFGAAGGGSLLRSFLDDKPETLPQALGTATQEGLLTGALPEGVGRGLAMLAGPVSRAAQSLMQQTLKPTGKAVLNAAKAGSDVPKVVQFMLDEHLPVTQYGLSQLNLIIKQSNDEVQKILTPIATRSIDPAKLAARADVSAARVGETINPETDNRAVQSVKDQFLRHKNVTQPGQVGTKEVPSKILNEQGNPAFTTQEPVMGSVPKNLTPLEAQKMKVASYQSLAKKAYEGKLTEANLESQKDILRGFREDIESAAKNAGKDVGAINEREGTAIEAREFVTKQLLRAGNNDKVALGFITTHPQATLMYALAVWPRAKSYIALGLWDNAAKLTGVAPEVLKRVVAGVLGSAQAPSAPKGK